jgi:hypothetical protein
MNVFLVFTRHPTPGIDRADDRPPAGVDVDVLDADLLLALAAVPVQRFEKGGVCWASQRHSAASASTCRMSDTSQALRSSASYRSAIESSAAALGGVSSRGLKAAFRGVQKSSS